jgi:hypothetical protein
MSFLGDLFDPAGAIATGGNNNTFDSIFSPGDNMFGSNGLGLEPSSINNFNSDTANSIDNFADSVGNTNLDELKNLGNHFGQNPTQMLTGVDPFSTKMWNGITGQKNTPWLNQYGGETNQDYSNSQSRGINTSGGQVMGTLANAIAGFYGGQALGNLAGNAYGAAFPSAGAGAGPAVPEGAMGSSALNMQAELANPALAGSGGSEAGWMANGAPGVTTAGASQFGGIASNFTGAVPGAAKGASANTANALDNGNQNPWGASIKGAATGGLTSGIDFAGAGGVDNPNYKNIINGGITGGIRSGMGDESQTGYGALVGALGGLGRDAGNYLSNFSNWGNSPSQASTSGTGSPASGVSNWENLAAGLGNMYLAHKANQGIQGQINNLNSLYAPNSPYAQQMQQALQRQDAAAGRGSQYGTRAVELQAALANAASRNAPMLSSLYGQQRMNNFNQLAGLFTMGKNSGLFNGFQMPNSGTYAGVNATPMPMGSPQAQMMPTDTSDLDKYQNLNSDVAQTYPNFNLGG